MYVSAQQPVRSNHCLCAMDNRSQRLPLGFSLLAFMKCPGARSKALGIVAFVRYGRRSSCHLLEQLGVEHSAPKLLCGGTSMNSSLTNKGSFSSSWGEKGQGAIFCFCQTANGLIASRFVGSSPVPGFLSPNRFR